MVNKLSEAQQNYIEVIYELSEEHSHAHVKNIANRLNVSMPTVTEALRHLEELNLVNHKHRQPVTLTSKGRKIAELLDKRHKVFSDFFRNILGFDSGYSENTACKLEHVIDDKLKERLLQFNIFLREYSQRTDCNIIEDFKKYIN
ncbi:MAG: metal-dependent transcriptional regulator [Victivallales bacterium]|nr:metal-dependent transcriptional regulator [Victivallales bacterium]MCF7889521.1 metal-dependent transcriptional regulator [Victivallales bacterium]